jgi:hypothetical protein
VSDPGPIKSERIIDVAEWLWSLWAVAITGSAAVLVLVIVWLLVKR